MNKIVDVKEIAQTAYLNLYKVIYLNKVGQTKTWIVASRKNYEGFVKKLEKKWSGSSDAVVLAALHAPSGKLVLIKQFRVSINDYVYELPAGLVEPSEVQMDCVKRELKEETGLDLIAIDVKRSLSGVYASAGMTEETLDLVFCTCEGELSDAYLEEDEDITAYLLSVSDVKQLLDEGAPMDVKAHLICKLYCAVGSDLWTK